MAYQFDGTTAVVTGASSGIGRATARRLATAGANVVVADVDEDGGEETVALIQAEGANATFVSCDVTTAGDIDTMIEAAVETYGSLDIAHNNAGIATGFGEFTEATDAEWDRIHDVNLKGVWACMQRELEYMSHHGGGAIVNTSSEAGIVGAAGLSTYSATKHGVVGLTRTAAVEYATAGIRVNAVCPGFVATKMTDEMDDDLLSRLAADTPMKRLGEVEEVADAVVWLCSEEASFITGHTLPIDGGATAE